MVFESPICFALLFIILQNSSTVPLICSAIAIAASFPECINKPFIKSSNVILSPERKFIPEPPTFAAFLETVTTSAKFPFSYATIAVNTFVVDAFGTLSYAFFSYNIWLYVLSYKIAFLEFKIKFSLLATVSISSNS